MRHNGLLILALASLAAACNDTVSPTNEQRVARVAITPAGAIALDVNAVLQLNAQAFTAGNREVPGFPVTWTSNQHAVASVTAGGLLSAHSSGTATITATIDGVAAHRTIAVRPVQEPPPPPSFSEAPLALVEGDPLPKVWWTGTITDELGNQVDRIVRVASGFLRVNLDDHTYEQQFTMDRLESTYIIVNGEQVFLGWELKETRAFDDRGSVMPIFEGSSTLVFQSTERQGHSFTGLATERGFDVTQRINASGQVLALRFAR
jgi:hypothetical protein